MTTHTSDDLDRARELRDAGVPVWVMAPNPGYDPQAPAKLPNGKPNPAAKEYRYPHEWESWTAQSIPAGHRVEDFQPGYAVCLSTGHGLDGADIDPKNGASVAAQRNRLDSCGVQVVGLVVTPSAGAHAYTYSVGVCSTSSSTKGVDYRGRGRDGSGGGFLYLPGTERPKYPGKVYTWAVPIDPADLDDLGGAPDPDNTDAVTTYLVGLGYKPRTRATSTGISGAEPLDVEALRPWLRELLDDLGPAWAVGPEGSQRLSTDRSERFFHLVAACRRAGLTQGQAVTALAPWCESVGKFLGRESEEVARAWEKVQPETEAYLRELDTASAALDDLEAAYAAPAATEGPEGSEHTPPDQEPPEAPERSSWYPVDLSAYLDGSYVPEEPTLLPRTDGAFLLYPGRLHSFHGESESGKSLIAQAEAARVLLAGGSVLVLDFESDAGAVVARLLAMGASREDLGSERFAYLRPESGLSDPAAREALDVVLRRRFDLAIVDGVTEALGLLVAREGTPEDQIVRYVRLLPRRIARRTGAAVVQVDHVTKSTEGRGRFALGSQHKLNALDGAAYTVEVVAPLGLGLRGIVTLRVAKDRPGQIRPRSGAFRKTDRTQEAARIVVDSTTPGRTVVTVEEPSTHIGQETDEAAGVWRPTGLMERVSRYLELQPEPVSGASVRRSVQGKDEVVLAALETLVLEGYVTRTTGGRGGGNLHASTLPYRQESDPRSDRYSGGEQVRGDEVAPDASFPPVPVPRPKTGEQGNRFGEGVDLFPGTGREQVGNRGTGREQDGPEADLWDSTRDPWTTSTREAPVHACAGDLCSVPGCEASVTT